MGLRNGLIPTSDISVSSQKNPDDTVDAVRLGNSKIWVAATNDSSPWIEVDFPESNFYSNLFSLIHMFFY
jgi:hypothetical protein